MLTDYVASQMAEQAQEVAESLSDRTTDLLPFASIRADSSPPNGSTNGGGL